LIERCIFAFGGNASGAVITCGGVTDTVIDCVVVFGNAGGDALCGIVTNDVTADPLSCDLPGGDYTLDASSPASGALSPCNQLVGACPVECGATPIRDTTWSAIKRTFAN